MVMNVRSSLHTHKYDGATGVRYYTYTSYEYSLGMCPNYHVNCVVTGKTARTAYAFTQSVAEKTATIAGVVNVRDRVHAHRYDKTSVVVDVASWRSRVSPADCPIHSFCAFTTIENVHLLPTSTFSIANVVEAPPHVLPQNIRDKRHSHKLTAQFRFDNIIASDLYTTTCPYGDENCKWYSHGQLVLTSSASTVEVDTKTIEW